MCIRDRSVLYCIGEKAEEQERWQEVLGGQLDTGLAGVDKGRVAIAYEPIWSIGPGKTPADRPYIQKIARFLKERTGGLPVAYGGGLKADNAAMLASIPEIDGGLIALTRFSGDIGFYPQEYLETVSYTHLERSVQTFMERYTSLKQRVYKANMRLTTLGLVILTWGNVSEIDRENGVIAIKPRGIEYQDLTAQDMVCLLYTSRCV